MCVYNDAISRYAPVYTFLDMYQENIQYLQNFAHATRGKFVRHNVLLLPNLSRTWK